MTDPVRYRAEPQNKWGFSTLKGIHLYLNSLGMMDLSFIYMHIFGQFLELSASSLYYFTFFHHRLKLANITEWNTLYG